MNSRVTANRVNDSADSVQHYCTPPWAARQLIDTLNELGIDTDTASVFDPAAGQGHLLHGLRADALNPMGYAQVYGDDMYDYSGRHYTATGNNYASLPPTFRGHVVTNPPFGQYAAFVEAAIAGGATLVAMLVRIPALCGADRARGIYGANPPRYIMPFTVRPHMQPGAPPEAGGNSAMDSMWAVWVMPHHEAYDGPRRTEVVWLPSDRRPFVRDDDWFSTYSVLPNTHECVKIQTAAAKKKRIKDKELVK